MQIQEKTRESTPRTRRGNFAPELVRTALPFLDGESGTKSWAEQVRKAD